MLFMKAGEGMSTRLSKLEERRAALAAKLQQIDAQLKTSSRKEDTRKKVLIGAVVLNRIELGLESEETLREWLRAGLIRNADRVVFGLPLLEDERAKKSKPKAKKSASKAGVAAQNLVAGTVQKPPITASKALTEIKPEQPLTDDVERDKKEKGKRSLSVSKTQRQLEDEFV